MVRVSNIQRRDSPPTPGRHFRPPRQTIEPHFSPPRTPGDPRASSGRRFQTSSRILLSDYGLGPASGPRFCFSGGPLKHFRPNAPNNRTPFQPDARGSRDVHGVRKEISNILSDPFVRLWPWAGARAETEAKPAHLGTALYY